jgi:hypothetical protein
MVGLSIGGIDNNTKENSQAEGENVLEPGAYPGSLKEL